MAKTLKTQFNNLYKIVDFSITNPKLVNRCAFIFTILMCAFIPFAEIDVDPENMLSKDEPARVFHNLMKDKMNINDLIVVGIQDSSHEKGVFNPKTLNAIYDFSTFIQTITWEDGSVRKGVVTHNILSPLQVDAIEAAGKGVIKFNRLMYDKITSQQEADAVLKRALNNPFLSGTMISNDHKSMSIYIPITSKSVSTDVYDELKNKIEHLDTNAQFHITGLPLAEDVFGIDMFIQMAISAPLAMMLIFALIYYFFRSVVIGLSALLVAMASVLITMGAFVAFGNTIHIMSSMIAIFLMPIAVLDAVHILSMFFDKYQKIKDREKTLHLVMHSLFTPMLYTSLTSAAGFFSLYFAPIPPIQVFGVFVGIGILIAWFFSMTLVPAYIMWIKPARMDSFGVQHLDHEEKPNSVLKSIGAFANKHAKAVIFVSIAIIGASIVGINKIKVNDNPMKWLSYDHPIRVADRFINENFGGNYLAYLTLEAAEDTVNVRSTIESQIAKSENEEFKQSLSNLLATNATGSMLLNEAWKLTNGHLVNQKEITDDSEDMESELDDIFMTEQPSSARNDWHTLQRLLSTVRDESQVFKNPNLLNYIAKLQQHIEQSSLVGKSNSLSDLVKKLNMELHDAAPSDYIIPETADHVSEAIVSFENSHEPFRIWHLVTQDYRTLNMWFQIKSGDNQDINKIVAQVEDYLKAEAPPVELKHQWFGLSFINTVWQQKMVSGMSDALISSMIVVLIIMTLLFRSIIWGVISMIPLSITILMIYGTIGLVGKDYDMPVAVLSALALGLAVDFAIHFISHSIEYVKLEGSWQKAKEQVFGEPSRAIFRNIIIIAVGFTPLLLAALVPYQTVGILMASIMLASGVATLLILPALFRVGHKWLFKGEKIKG